MPTIVSIQVGQPMTYAYTGAADGKERSWTTAFFKMPLTGSVWAGTTNIAGDQQADRKNHGGIDKAVLAYSADSPCPRALDDREVNVLFTVDLFNEGVLILILHNFCVSAGHKPFRIFIRKIDIRHSPGYTIHSPDIRFAFCDWKSLAGHC
jgi:hypothetical protein